MPAYRLDIRLINVGPRRVAHRPGEFEREQGDFPVAGPTGRALRLELLLKIFGQVAHQF